MSPRNSGNGSFLPGASEIVLAHLEDEYFGVSNLARELGMSRSNLHRKIQIATGKSVSQFMREIRLNKALELLKESDLTIAEVAYRVGFGSATYFSKCFHDHFGYPPGEAAEREIENTPSTEPQGDSNDSGPVNQRNPIRWFIPVFALILIALASILLFSPLSFHPRSNDVVVAVLPFINDSPDQQNDYIINGLMEEILNKLSKIDGLDVVSRTTMELYRDSEKNIRQIAREVDADYIMEGSATILNNRTRIRLQLIEPARDSHIWSEPYEREITEDNIFEIQEEIALAVTDGLDIVRDQEITSLVHQRPTKNREAYDDYLQARNLLNINLIKPDEESLQRFLQSKTLLEKAISFDSTFADAYTHLAGIYINNIYYWKMYSDLEKASAYLDTGLIIAEKAIHFYEIKNTQKRPADQYYQYALALKAVYFLRHGNRDQAEYYFIECRKGIHWTYSEYMGEIEWYHSSSEYYAAVDNYLKYIDLKPEDVIVPWFVDYDMYEVFRQAGFPEQAEDQINNLLILSGDSVSYLANMADLYMLNGNYSQALQFREKLTGMIDDQLDNNIYQSRIHIYMGELDSAQKIVTELINQLEEEGREIPDHWLIAYVSQLLGNGELTDSLLMNDLEYELRLMQFPLPYYQKSIPPFTIARIYSIMGNREKTLEYLGYIRDIPSADSYFIHELKNWPSFDLVRDTPEYKEILADLERRFNKEHERIERLLKKEGYI